MADADLQIKISTSAEIGALKDLERELTRSFVRAKALGDDKGVEQFGKQLAGVQGQIGGFSAGQKMASELDQVARSIPGVGGAIDLLSGSASRLAIGLGIASAAGAAAQKALGEFGQAMEAYTELDATLANMGKLTEQNRAATQGLASEMQRATGIADEKWLGVQNKLLRMGAANLDNLGAQTEHVKNLAGAIGVDIETAAQMFIRAQNGNYRALQMYGFQVDKNLPKQERFNQLLKQIDARGMGVLEAKAKTLQGQTQALGNAWSDVWESMGNILWKTGILQFFTDTSKGLAQIANDFATFFGGPMAQAEGLVNKTGVAMGKMGEAGEEATEEIADGFKKVKEENDKALESLKRYNSEMDKSKDARLRELEAVRDLMLQEIETNGKLTESQKVAQKAKVEQSFTKEKFALEQSTDNAKIARNESQIDKIDTQSAQAQTVIKKSSEADKIREQIGTNDKLSNGANLSIDRLEREISENNRTSKLKAYGLSLGGPAGYAAAGALLKENAAKNAELEARIDSIKNSLALAQVDKQLLEKKLALVEVSKDEKKAAEEFLKASQAQKEALLLETNDIKRKRDVDKKIQPLIERRQTLQFADQAFGAVNKESEEKKKREDDAKGKATDAVIQKAEAINQEALNKAGVQGGEKMADAVGIALEEMGLKMSDLLAEKINEAIARSEARLKEQLKNTARN